MRTKQILLYIPNLNDLKMALQEVHQKITIKKIENIRIFELYKTHPNWSFIDFREEHEGEIEIFPIYYPTIRHNISKVLRNLLNFNDQPSTEEKKQINALSTKSARLVYLKIKI